MASSPAGMHVRWVRAPAVVNSPPDWASSQGWLSNVLDLCEATFGPHHLSTAHAHALLGRFLARSADMRAASDHLCGALDAVKLQAPLA